MFSIFWKEVHDVINRREDEGREGDRKDIEYDVIVLMETTGNISLGVANIKVDDMCRGREREREGERKREREKKGKKGKMEGMVKI